MSVEAQVLDAVSDFEAAVKKQQPKDLRKAAHRAARDLARCLPALEHNLGQETLERLFLDTLAA